MTQKQADNPTIYILHGWSLEPELKDRWNSLRELLHQEGYKTNYLLLPGFDQPLTQPLTLNHYRDYVLERIGKKEKVILIGHSFGGQLAVRLAAAQPDNLKAIILIAPAGIIDRSLTKRAKRMVFKTAAKMGKLIADQLPLPTQQKLEKLLYKAAREQDYHRAPPAMKQTMQNVLADEVISDFPQVEVPTLIIWGDKDRYTPIKHAPLFVAHIFQAQLKIIAGESHRPYYTQPELVADHINYFLKKHVV